VKSYTHQGRAEGILPKMHKSTFLTKKLRQIYFFRQKFIYFFSVKNPAREAYSGHSGARSAPPLKKDKFLSAPMVQLTFCLFTFLLTYCH